jgi:hypothetical protein
VSLTDLDSDGLAPSESRDLTGYSLAIIKHLYGTWRDRPRR